MEIQVRINSEGALRNQRYAFTNRYTLISELLQNARRAGATLIELSHDEPSQTLRVRDNGRGIEDFQKLLTIHESGWDEPLQQQETAFGVGFSKCLYASSRCIVTSNGREVDFDTASALAQTPIPVSTRRSVDDQEPGTIIELYGVDLPKLAQHVEEMCRGFPVAVEFNGRNVSRPDAPDALATHATAVGAVYLAGTDDGQSTQHTRFYLQGFCVYREPRYHGLRDSSNVVHLDPKRFLARLPDRDKLIDEEEQASLVDTELKTLWRRILEGCKASLPAGAFVETYFNAMRTWGHVDLLDDVDVLPSALCDVITSYPIQEGTSSCSFLETVLVAPTREDVESGRVRLASLDAPCDTSMASWMLAKQLDLVIVDAHILKDTHWVHQHVRELECEAVTVEAIAQSHQTKLEGRWLWTDVVLCERVRIQIGADVVELHDDGLFHGDTLFIPLGETSGCAVQQASTFVDSYEHFHEEDMEADTETLAELIRRLRAVDPVATLRSMLEQLKLENYPLLRGRAFRVSVGQDALQHAVDLLD